MHIFNVLVKGFSIGMTFSLKQAQEWVRQSVNGAVIVPVRYRPIQTKVED